MSAPSLKQRFAAAIRHCTALGTHCTCLCDAGAPSLRHTGDFIYCCFAKQPLQRPRGCAPTAPFGAAVVCYSVFPASETHRSEPVLNCDQHSLGIPWLCFCFACVRHGHRGPSLNQTATSRGKGHSVRAVLRWQRLRRVHDRMSLPR